jgi:ring-1,2-phenylacetyl-CoA epoxidase subunit PaaD
VVSEAGTHIAIARARAGVDASHAPGPRTAPDEAAVRAALAEVMDPELPMISIVDLGMVGAVGVTDSIDVALLPTYVGCPALDLIRGAVVDRLAAFGVPVTVRATFETPWSSERITPAGLAALASAGIAPPTDVADARCPLCASADVVRDSLFGPTQCRSLYYCRTCRQPFEAIKPV